MVIVKQNRGNSCPALFSCHTKKEKKREEVLSCRALSSLGNDKKRVVLLDKWENMLDFKWKQVVQ